MEKGSIGVGMRLIDTDEKLKKVPDEFKPVSYTHLTLPTKA